MIKATITRLFIGGGLAIVTGAIVAVIAIGIAMANDIFVMNGPDVVGVRGSALAFSLLGLAIVGSCRDHGRSDRGPRGVDRSAAEYLAAGQQGLVRRSPIARDLQLRVLRDDRVPRRRTRWHDRCANYRKAQAPRATPA